MEENSYDIIYKNHEQRYQAQYTELARITTLNANIILTYGIFFAGWGGLVAQWVSFRERYIYVILEASLFFLFLIFYTFTSFIKWETPTDPITLNENISEYHTYDNISIKNHFIQSIYAAYNINEKRLNYALRIRTTLYIIILLISLAVFIHILFTIFDLSLYTFINNLYDRCAKTTGK